MYICPMHPEVKSDRSGKCPKCGMELVQNKEDELEKNYIPLFVVVASIFLVALVVSSKDFTIRVSDSIFINNNFSIFKFISYFMSGFFITFAGFKLLDLKGFVEGYSTYDLLAMRFKPYAYLYPFIELFFGLAMIADFRTILVLKLEVLVMSFSGLGVLWKLLKGEKFQCVCLGTVLKVPLTKVTLIEDFGMATLAILLLALT